MYKNPPCVVVVCLSRILETIIFGIPALEATCAECRDIGCLFTHNVLNNKSSISRSCLICTFNESPMVHARMFAA